MRKIILILHIQTALHVTGDIIADDEYPDINFLFHVDKSSASPVTYKDAIIKNISIDLEKLDIKKFRSKLNSMKLKIKDKSEEVNIENKMLVPARRQKELKWKSVLDNMDFTRAENLMASQKALDLMLQYIYMAKHKLNILQTNRYYSITDTGYRIGYGYRKLTRMYRRVRDIFQMMVNTTNNYTIPVDIHLQLHLKATKIHVDFLYLWWILVRIDGKYKTRVGKKNTIPEWMYYPYTADLNPVLCSYMRRKAPLPHGVLIDDIINTYFKRNAMDVRVKLLHRVIDDVSSNQNSQINKTDSNAKLTFESGRRSVDQKPSDFFLKISFDLMEQSIYATRYRLRESDFYRKKFSSSTLYKMGYLYGNILELVGKIEHMVALQERMFSYNKNTHFLWYLILYEKCLAAHVDLTTAVERMFQYRKEHINSENKSQKPARFTISDQKNQ